MSEKPIHGVFPEIVDKYPPDAVKKQPMSSGGGDTVIDKVIEDLKLRDAFGIKKYGTTLKTNNGRSALIDLYQEILDAAMYCKQLLMEQGD